MPRKVYGKWAAEVWSVESVKQAGRQASQKASSGQQAVTNC